MYSNPHTLKVCPAKDLVMSLVLLGVLLWMAGPSYDFLSASLIRKQKLHALSITGIEYLRLSHSVPVCVADFLDPKLVQDMKEVLSTMHTTVSGRQLLMIFQLRRNFSFKPEHLIETERVYQAFQNMKIMQD